MMPQSRDMRGQTVEESLGQSYLTHSVCSQVLTAKVISVWWYHCCLGGGGGMDLVSPVATGW
jgi:hypothetical protein